MSEQGPSVTQYSTSSFQSQSIWIKNPGVECNDQFGTLTGRASREDSREFQCLQTDLILPRTLMGNLAKIMNNNSSGSHCQISASIAVIDSRHGKYNKYIFLVLTLQPLFVSAVDLSRPNELNATMIFTIIRSWKLYNLRKHGWDWKHYHSIYGNDKD